MGLRQGSAEGTEGQVRRWAGYDGVESWHDVLNQHRVGAATAC